MARQPRFVLPNYPQHVIQRGNNRGIIFQDPGDYNFYLEKLLEASKKHECKIHAYVLMTNHVHLLLTPLLESSISKMQQMIGRYYVPYYNNRYLRTGTLWEGRYRATLIESEKYFLSCMRYIELNPVRAKIINHPALYPWSSYHFNALGKSDSLINPHDEYLSLGETIEKRLQAYQALYELPISQKTINDIRDATNKAWALGDEAFKIMLESKISRRVVANLKGGVQKSQKYKTR
jgi:putative transposase